MPRGRKPKEIKTVERKINIPETLDAKLQLMLFSEVDQRVPYGALSSLIVPMLEDFMRRYTAMHAAMGTVKGGQQSMVGAEVGSTTP